MPNTLDRAGSATPALALGARELAAALGISTRALWTWTNRGEVPHVRLGKRVLYPVARIEAWLAKRSEGKRA